MKALLVGLLFVILSMTAMAQQQGKYFFVKSGHIEYTLPEQNRFGSTITAC